jgi:hypothetical protein
MVTLPSWHLSDTAEFFLGKGGKSLDSWEIAPIIRGNLDIRKTCRTATEGGHHDKLW